MLSTLDYTALQVEHAVLNAKFVNLQKQHAKLVEQDKTRAKTFELVFDALLVCATSSFMWNLSSQVELYNASIDTFVNRIVKVNSPIHASPSEKGCLLLVLFAFVLLVRQVFKTRSWYVTWWVFIVYGTYVYMQAQDAVLGLMGIDPKHVFWASDVIGAVLCSVYCFKK